MDKAHINPDNLFNARQFGFSQAVVSSPGRIVFISGQVAWDKDMQIVGKGDLEKQTEMAVLNVQRAIEAAGGTLRNIVMLRIYKVGLHEDEGVIVGRVLRKYFGIETPPASTWLNVSGLAHPDFMIEIEAQAVISSSG
jgi:2-iminobutanoate/2-iminopropanoate deaminase